MGKAGRLAGMAGCQVNPPEGPPAARLFTVRWPGGGTRLDRGAQAV